MKRKPKENDEAARARRAPSEIFRITWEMPAAQRKLFRDVAIENAGKLGIGPQRWERMRAAYKAGKLAADMAMCLRPSRFETKAARTKEAPPPVRKPARRRVARAAA